MIKINTLATISPDQLKAVIKGVRNPMDSWDKSDSVRCRSGDCDICLDYDDCPFGHNPDKLILGENDHKLMMNLTEAGSSHSKYRRMIPVWVDIAAPLYWWKEFDTYKVGTVSNSCSTMHKIHAKELTLDDFSTEHLNLDSIDILGKLISGMDEYRNDFLACNDKEDWWQIIQLLPTSYNQTRTVFLNYEVLAAMYADRKNHKLDEWKQFCKWIEGLPMSDLITGKKKDKKE